MVAYCKFPPKGKRSLTASLPHFDFQRAAREVIQQLDDVGSTVLLLIETKDALHDIDAIAAVEGVDVLLVGANDLSLEPGILGEWEHSVLQSALETVAAAARRCGKVFGICGLYTRPDIYRRVCSNGPGRSLCAGKCRCRTAGYGHETDCGALMEMDKDQGIRVDEERMDKRSPRTCTSRNPFRPRSGPAASAGGNRKFGSPVRGLTDCKRGNPLQMNNIHSPDVCFRD